ncbi:MAG: hypothetical protein HN820_03305 [Candidatus Marinimicrobia bacterium]|jgi:tetratricopeptide (TPR) repeat protein|nr:hypothetical protein [Candidatus Neomarinimicrobiota bacterium]MBT7377166.1 hypothetical protein [Candidatus Neomarinimicrobiota bacterium]
MKAKIFPLLISLLISVSFGNHFNTLSERISENIADCFIGNGRLELVCDDMDFLKELIKSNQEYQPMLDENSTLILICDLFNSTNNPSVLLNYGTIFAISGKNLDAILILNEVIHLDSTLDRAYNNLALVYFAMGESELAYYNLMVAIEVNPKNTEALRSLGNYYYDRDDMDMCLKYTRRAAELGNIPSKNWLAENNY